MVRVPARPRSPPSRPVGTDASPRSRPDSVSTPLRCRSDQLASRLYRCSISGMMTRLRNSSEWITTFSSSSRVVFCAMPLASVDPCDDRGLGGGAAKARPPSVAVRSGWWVGLPAVQRCKWQSAGRRETTCAGTTRCSTRRVGIRLPRPRRSRLESSQSHCSQKRWRAGRGIPPCLPLRDCGGSARSKPLHRSVQRLSVYRMGTGGTLKVMSVSFIWSSHLMWSFSIVVARSCTLPGTDIIVPRVGLPVSGDAWRRHQCQHRRARARARARSNHIVVAGGQESLQRDLVVVGEGRLEFAQLGQVLVREKRPRRLARLHVRKRPSGPCDSRVRVRAGELMLHAC